MKTVPHKRKLVKPTATMVALSNYVWHPKDVMDKVMEEIIKRDMKLYLYGNTLDFTADFTGGHATNGKHSEDQNNSGSGHE